VELKIKKAEKFLAPMARGLTEPVKFNSVDPSLRSFRLPTAVPVMPAIACFAVVFYGFHRVNCLPQQVPSAIETHWGTVQLIFSYLTSFRR